MVNPLHSVGHVAELRRLPDSSRPDHDRFGTPEKMIVAGF